MIKANGACASNEHSTSPTSLVELVQSASLTLHVTAVHHDPPRPMVRRYHLALLPPSLVFYVSIRLAVTTFSFIFLLAAWVPPTTSLHDCGSSPEMQYGSLPGEPQLSRTRRSIFVY